MTIVESKNLIFTSTDDEKTKARCAKDLLYAILTMNTIGSAKEIVKEVTVPRSGVEASVRLRERFSRTTGATSHAEIFQFIWTSNKSFEDDWREWGAKMSKLSAGSLSDSAKEALAIECASIAHQTALDQHTRLKSPQGLDRVGEDL